MSELISKIYIKDEFTCLANQCPDTCCNGAWSIYINNDAIEQWKLHTDKDLSKKLLDSIELSEDGGEDKYRFRMNDNGLCFHMNDTGFCSIHDSGLQPYVCSKYPRLNYDVGFMRIETLNLSCPEVARLVLQSTNKRVLENSKELRSWLQYNQDKNNSFTSLEAYMQRMLFMLWKKNQYSYQIRLAFLAKLLVYIVSSSVEVEINRAFFEDIFTSMPALLKGFSKNIDSNELHPEKEPSETIWMSCLLVVKKKMSDLIDKKSRSLEFLKNNDSEGLYSYIGKLNVQHKQKIDALSPLIDKYLEASFLNKTFPCKPYWDNYIASFLNVVIPLFCIKILLYVQLEMKGDLTEQDIVNTVYKVERNVQQNFIYSCLAETPEMLEIERYYLTFLEL